MQPFESWPSKSKSTSIQSAMLVAVVQDEDINIMFSQQFDRALIAVLADSGLIVDPRHHGGLIAGGRCFIAKLQRRQPVGPDIDNQRQGFFSGISSAEDTNLEPRSFNSRASQRQLGFPVPPTVRLPMLMTGFSSALVRTHPREKNKFELEPPIIKIRSGQKQEPKRLAPNPCAPKHCGSMRA